MVGPVSRDQQELGFEGIPADVINSYTQAQMELVSINSKITQIREKAPNSLFCEKPTTTLYCRLEEAAIPEEIEDPLVRKYMVLTYNTLGSVDRGLTILRLPMSELKKIYIYDTSMNRGIDEWLDKHPIDKRIREIGAAYLQERSSRKEDDFVPVIKYLSALVTADVPGDLNGLSLFCLNERKQQVEQTINHLGPMIVDYHAKYFASQRTV